MPVKSKKQTLPKPTRESIVLYPERGSIDDILRYTDPGPDEETEAFVAAIYADRREAHPSASGK
jgi:hypothetical protein